MMILSATIRRDYDTNRASDARQYTATHVIVAFLKYMMSLYSSNKGIIHRSDVIIMTMWYVLLCILVPGLGGSPLNAQDSSNSGCNTNNESIRIYINVTHIVNQTDCFGQQLM